MTRHYIKDNEIIKSVNGKFVNIEAVPDIYDFYKDSDFSLIDRVIFDWENVVIDTSEITIEMPAYFNS